MGGALSVHHKVASQDGGGDCGGDQSNAGSGKGSEPPGVSSHASVHSSAQHCSAFPLQWSLPGDPDSALAPL